MSHGIPPGEVLGFCALGGGRGRLDEGCFPRERARTRQRVAAAALLLGPLYNLTERAERLLALADPHLLAVGHR